LEEFTLDVITERKDRRNKHKGDSERSTSGQHWLTTLDIQTEMHFCIKRCHICSNKVFCAPICIICWSKKSLSICFLLTHVSVGGGNKSSRGFI